MSKKLSKETIGVGLSVLAIGALVSGTAMAAENSTGAVGIGAPDNSISAGQFTTTATPSGMALPVQHFEVSAPFGDSTGAHAGRHHNGVDLAAPTGTKVYSATAGEVIQAGSSGGYGNLITIKTPDGYEVMYAHLSAMKVKKGDTVSAGDVIGKVGNTGHSTGPHLHFEVHNPKGKVIDPVKYLGLTNASLAALGEK